MSGERRGSYAVLTQPVFSHYAFGGLTWIYFKLLYSSLCDLGSSIRSASIHLSGETKWWMGFSPIWAFDLLQWGSVVAQPCNLDRCPLRTVWDARSIMLEDAGWKRFLPLIPHEIVPWCVGCIGDSGFLPFWESVPPLAKQAVIAGLGHKAETMVHDHLIGGGLLGAMAAEVGVT